LIVQYDNFRSLFQLKEKVDYQTFVNNIKVRRNQKIMPYTPGEFLAERNDWRSKQKNIFYKNLYDICVTNREDTLRKWFDVHIKIDDLDQHMNFDLSENIIENGIILGRKQNKGRIVKNINFDKIFLTKKYNINDNMPILKSLDEMLNDFVINSNLIIPNGFKKVTSYDLSDIFAIMRGTRHRASIFNPYTYGWLLQNYFTGSRVISATAGWNAYQIGFHQTDWEEFTCIDVIESVIENSRKIADYYDKSLFNFNSEKVVNAHCCPSEKIDLEEKNYYDLCLFSPPYYNLEVYDSDNQSLTSFPEYKDWLEGYWDKTVENISKTLKVGGTFSFVISDYKNIFSDNKKETYDTLPISQDMLNVALRHFNFKKTENIAWGSFSTLNGKMASGNIEDMHILTKQG
jgi:hypothetical protein